MNEEMGFALDAIAKSVRGTEPCGLTRVLFETANSETWSLFRLDNNTSFDDTLPRWNEHGAHGNFYAFFYNQPPPGRSIRDRCVASHLTFHESDANAVRWALGLADNYMGAPGDEPEPTDWEPDEIDEYQDNIPF